MKKLLNLFFLVLLPTSIGFAQNFHLSTAFESVAQLIVVGADGRTPQVTATAFFVGDGSVVASAAHVYWGMGTAINNQRGGLMWLQKNSSQGRPSISRSCRTHKNRR